jgi:hypothetical protein
MKQARFVALMILGLLLACSDALMGPATSSDRASLFDDLWDQFDLHYSFFDMKHVNWDSLGAHYRPLALAAGSDREFAEALGSMLGELQDVHVALTPASVSGTLRYIAQFETTPTFFDVQRVLTHYVTSPRTTTGGHLRYGMVAPTVGYAYMGSFEGSNWDGEMDEVLNSLPSAKSLIIDVRNNYGGTQSLAAAIAGRFADRVRTFGYVRRRNGRAHGEFTDYVAETVGPMGSARFSGHVFVLANRASISTAEDYVLAMRALPTVTIVGDTTAGASGGPIVRELENGWTYQLSEWIEYTPERLPFEGIGLAPDIAIKASALDAAASVDAVLERARALAMGM